MLDQILVISHGDCNDGTGAAWALNERHDCSIPLENFFLLKHGNIEGQLTDMGFFDKFAYCQILYVLDYSLPFALLQRLLKADVKIIEIDHHKTFWDRAGTSIATEEYLEKFKETGKYQYYFHNGMSNAVLTWLYANLEEEELLRVLEMEGEPLYEYLDTHVPDCLLFIQDRDIWLWRHNDSKAYCEAFFLYNREPLKLIANQDLDSLTPRYITEGESLLWQKDIQLSDLMKQARDVSINIDGEQVKGKFASCSKFFTSELGNLLIRSEEDVKFAILVDFDKDFWKCVVRSTPDFDSTVIAKQFGGGGHAQACGFRIHEPMVLLRMMQPGKHQLKLKTKE